MARSAVTSGKLGKIALEMGVEGIPELKERIAQKVKALGGAEAKKIFMAAGLMVVREVRSDIHNITGTLSSAVFAAYGKENKPNVIVGVKIGSRGIAPYGPAVEHGHAIHRGGRIRQGTGTTLGKVPPHPYFNPGVKAAAPTAGAIIVQGLVQLVEK